MENTIVQTRPKNNGRLRSNGLKCEATAVTVLATSRRRESYVSDGACHLEGIFTILTLAKSSNSDVLISAYYGLNYSYLVYALSI
ncbi:hypothetical protein J6590_084431 [Homalodisca vitripennis]|nr:hypothetical protein J6590_084431 [Homalodisca vitripennis]